MELEILKYCKDMRKDMNLKDDFGIGYKVALDNVIVFIEGRLDEMSKWLSDNADKPDGEMPY